MNYKPTKPTPKLNKILRKAINSFQSKVSPNMSDQRIGELILESISKAVPRKAQTLLSLLSEDPSLATDTIPPKELPGPVSAIDLIRDHLVWNLFSQIKDDYQTHLSHDDKETSETDPPDDAGPS